MFQEIPMSEFRFDPFGPTYRLPRGFARPRRRFAGLLVDALMAFAGGLAAWGRRRRDMRRLAEMDDRQLADIGISRAEISRAVRPGRE